MDDKIIVRKMHNKKSDKWWYEEKIGDDWEIISGTRMGCSGNADSELGEYIKRRRKEYEDYHTDIILECKEIYIGFDATKPRIKEIDEEDWL